jgi:hypothetical protein
MCPASNCPTAILNAGTPIASGNYLITGNLFRTRDTLRQDIIDQSQLVQVLGVNPLSPPSGADILAKMGSAGAVIDPTRIYFVGQSLGGIQGAADIAANPRITKALLNVSGETIVDLFSNSPTLRPGLVTLLGTLTPPILPNTPQFLQFLNVAKWVLDPAEPANFGDHITRNTLANLIKSGLPPPLNSDPMLPKKVLGQYAQCDDTVGNPFNLLQFKHIGLGPVTSTTGTLTVFTTDPAATSPAACPTGTVKHGFLTDWVTYPGATGITQTAQDDAAKFFGPNDTPAPLVRP